MYTNRPLTLLQEVPVYEVSDLLEDVSTGQFEFDFSYKLPLSVPVIKHILED